MHEVWRNSEIATLGPAGLMLVTDFDGTLSEIVSDPAKAMIVSESLAALSRLTGVLERVTVLSSRSTADLVRLIPVRGVDLIGDSGLNDLSPDELERLHRFNAEAARMFSNMPGVWLEIKPGASAVHYRHSRATVDDVLGVLRPVLDATSLHAQRGRRVIEVLPRDHPKGDALADLIEEHRPAAVMCIGDDENDRPMFEVVAGLDRPHLAVGVASEEVQPGVFASCDLVLSGPEEVSRFLAMLSEWATRGRGVRNPQK